MSTDPNRIIHREFTPEDVGIFFDVESRVARVILDELSSDIRAIAQTATVIVEARARLLDTFEEDDIDSNGYDSKLIKLLYDQFGILREMQTVVTTPQESESQLIYLVDYRYSDNPQSNEPNGFSLRIYTGAESFKPYTAYDPSLWTEIEHNDQVTNLLLYAAVSEVLPAAVRNSNINVTHLLGSATSKRVSN